jgi:hypothetical protein
LPVEPSEPATPVTKAAAEGTSVVATKTEVAPPIETARAEDTAPAPTAEGEEKGLQGSTDGEHCERDWALLGDSIGA